jgi:hypothetical protein
LFKKIKGANKSNTTFYLTCTGIGGYARILIWIICFSITANEDTKEQRLIIAEECLNDMINWLDMGGQVGIYDASNTTDERRAWIQRKLNEHNIQTLFIGN